VSPPAASVACNAAADGLSRSPSNRTIAVFAFPIGVVLLAVVEVKSALWKAGSM
jgi:hypothetical protein